MKLSYQQRFGTTGDKGTDSVLNILWQEIVREINGLIGFGTPANGPENIDGTWYTGTTPAGANTEFSVTHNLGSVPAGWILMSIDKAAIVYKGTTAWTEKTISLKCNVASTTIAIFIISGD